METEKIVYAIQNKEGLFATYGRSEFHKDLRFARLYKSKKTALKHYFNNKGEYKNLTLVGLQIKIVSKEELKQEEFSEYKVEEEKKYGKTNINKL